MIESTRPVRGQDIEDLREKLCLTSDDMCWLIGVAMPRWSHMIKPANNQKEINDKTIALLVRLFDARPELVFIPIMPSPGDIFDMINEVEPNTSMKEASIMLGREGSSCFHWIQRGRRASPPVLRLGYVLRDILNNDKKNAKKFVQEIRKFVDIESSARNVRNIWETGSWVNKSDAGKSNRGRKKKVVETMENSLAE